MPTVDFARKRVWLGLRLPGKKMIALSREANIQPLFRGGRLLIECYQGPPWKGLLCAAICLHELAEDEDAALHADVFADTRDFLMLRYRAQGLEDISYEGLEGHLRSGSLPAGVAPDRPDLVINYAVNALDLLAADADVSRAALTTTLLLLRDLAEPAARLLAEEQYSEEDWAELAPLWDAAVAWRRRAKPAARRAA